MNFYKRAVSIAASLILTSQVCGSVFADNASYYDTYDNSSITEEDNQSQDTSFKDGDPSYYKYLESQYMSLPSSRYSIWGSSALTHASRFNSFDKAYGIDVSYYQGDIDWQAVKNSGVEYVIIRVGYRGYGSSGTLVLDKKFYEYMDGAKAAGLDVGVYFYTQAINTAEAKEEANFVLQKIKGYSLDLPVYYDIEGVDYDTGRLDSANLSKAQKTSLCRAFCDTIKANGYEAGVYTNYSWFMYQIDGKSLGDSYPIWLAHYTTSTDYPYDYQMWQYSGQGRVNGISGAVDMDVRYINNSYQNKKVTNLGKTDTAQTKVMLKWDAVPGAQGYAVYTKDSDGSYTLRTTSNTNSCTVTGLNMATVYTFNVRPYFNADKSEEYINGKSSLGGLSDDYVQGTKTSKAYGMTVTGQTDNSITVKWDAAKGRYDGYQVAFYNTDTKKHVAVEYTNSTSYTYKGLKAGTNYNVTVRPYYIQDGVKYPGVFADYVQTSTAPAKVTGLAASQFYNNKITLKWNKVSGATSYKVYIVKNGKSEYIKDASSNTVSIGGASVGKSYTYTVRAVKSLNGKEYLGAESAQKKVTFTYSAPTNVKVSNIKTNSVSLSWTKAPYASGYQIYLYDPTSKAYKKVRSTSPTVSKLTIDGLKSKTSYKVKITASYGSSSSSDVIVSFKTK